MAVPPPHVNDLPTHVLSAILLRSTTHDVDDDWVFDLTSWVSVCARVCAEWRLIVQRSAAYWPYVPGSATPSTSDSARRQGSLHIGPSGCWATQRLTAGERGAFLSTLGRFDRERRAAQKDATEQQQVMRTISTVVQRTGHQYFTVKCDLGERGFFALAAAVQAVPVATRKWVRDVALENCGLSLAVVDQMTLPSAFPLLESLSIFGNPQMGDAALTLVAGVLPSTLTKLNFSNTGCGDAGMAAVVAATPRLNHLCELKCGYNDAVTEVGWVALAEALPQLPALEILWTTWDNPSRTGGLGNHSMGPAFALAFASVLPRCAPTFASLGVRWATSAIWPGIAPWQVAEAAWQIQTSRAAAHGAAASF
jgi:hypothetical protein